MTISTGLSFDLVRELARLPDCGPAFHPLGSFNGSMLGIFRISEQPPWECHPDGDEYLNVLVIEVEVIVLPKNPEDKVYSETLRAGAMYVVPKGLWHGQKPTTEVTLPFMTAAETTMRSDREDPRIPENR